MTPKNPESNQEASEEEKGRTLNRAKKRELGRLVRAASETDVATANEEVPEAEPITGGMALALQRAVKERKEKEGTYRGNPGNVSELRSDLTRMVVEKEESSSTGGSAAVPEGLVGGGIPVFITRRLRRELEGLGYNEEQIKKMTPQEAWNIAGNKAKDNESEKAANKITDDTVERAPEENARVPETKAGEASPKKESSPRERRGGSSKEGWTDIDRELSKKVNELRKTGDKQEKRKLENEIASLKEKKFGAEPIRKKELPRLSREETRAFLEQQAAQKKEKTKEEPRLLTNSVPFAAYKDDYMARPFRQTEIPVDERKEADAAPTESAAAIEQQGGEEAPENKKKVVRERGKYPITETIGDADKDRLHAENVTRRERAISGEVGLEKIKAFKEALQKRTEVVEERVRREGGGKFYEFVRIWGKRYKKMPLAGKMAIGGGILAAGILSAGVGSVLGGMVVSAAIVGRGLATGAATFATLENLLDKNFEKREKEGKPLSEREKRRMRGELVILSGLAGGVLGHAIGNLAEAAGNLLAPAVGVPASAPAAVIETQATAPDYTVEKGDTMYKILRTQIPGIDELKGHQQENAIENILAEIKKDPASYGIASGNVNAIKPGDAIDIEKIMGIMAYTEIQGESILDRASRLPEIHAAADAAPEHPGVMDAATQENSEEPEENAARQQPDNTGQTPLATEEAEATGAKEETYVGRTTIASGTINENLVVQYFDTPEKGEGVLDRRDIVSLEDARDMRTAKLNELFGKRHFFGGITLGEDSPEWNSLKKETVIGVMQNETAQGAEKKMREFLTDLVVRSGEIPGESESVDNFIKRGLFALTKKGVTIT